ncbi:hypothetical protein H4R34_001209 [Dimargaris verticillata]|uniref:tRNA-guanine(15) transglycosylase-like domain-containing protein n=1 Tax=Dimargaris verticillata TaxID=2761393 RepID=A0A9W8EE03_9FUNG|nr:hypothetical protein H4R34_001209 [Dimargaris verticillata]
MLDVRDPSLQHVASHHSNKYYKAETDGGVRKFGVSDYIRLIRTIQPEIAVALADDLNTGDISEAWSKKSVTRSLKWLDECLVGYQSSSAIFGVLKGGPVLDQRQLSAELTAQRDVAGFVLNDLQFAGDATARRQWLQTSLAPLPSAKPRLAYALGTPLDVLEGVRQGIDLFDTLYPMDLVEKGHAMVFSFEKGAPAPATPQSLIIDISQPEFRTDRRPLDEQCPCQACIGHSRAYLHHLWHTSEMLVKVLLMVHNLHAYAAFFAQIRHSLRQGTFSAQADVFAQRYAHPR